MATKRKVDNLLALAVLATVYQRPMHRYEMASIMRARGKERDMNIKWGSLYTVVQNMEKHGFLEIIGSARQGARPERTIYGITEAGKHELVEWTQELISTPQPEHSKFTAGLSVLAVLSPRDATALLRTRLARLEESIDSEQAALSEQGKELPRLFRIESEYRVTMLRAEAAWLRSLLDELVSGTFPDIAAWQAWHTTGEMPEDLAALAESGAEPD